MKKVLTAIFLIVVSTGVYSQSHIRDVIVEDDTCFEANPIHKNFQISEVHIRTGIRFTVIDNPYGIFYFSVWKDKAMNGAYFQFYIPSGMPQEKGEYIDGLKTGEWFFWNEKGRLTRKEVWKSDTLVSRKYY